MDDRQDGRAAKEGKPEEGHGTAFSQAAQALLCWRIRRFCEGVGTIIAGNAIENYMRVENMTVAIPYFAEAGEIRPVSCIPYG
jgi:hypothetical protein